jgi:hypothetical protein
MKEKAGTLPDLKDGCWKPATEPADAEEIAMIEEGMREYENNPPSFTDWKTVKKELGLS